MAVFRRGPSNWIHVGRWDLAGRRYEPGAWMGGRIFPRRSDLSPDGPRWGQSRSAVQRRPVPLGTESCPRAGMGAGMVKRDRDEAPPDRPPGLPAPPSAERRGGRGQVTHQDPRGRSSGVWHCRAGIYRLDRAPQRARIAAGVRSAAVTFVGHAGAARAAKNLGEVLLRQRRRQGAQRFTAQTKSGHGPLFHTSSPLQKQRLFVLRIEESSIQDCGVSVNPTGPDRPDLIDLAALGIEPPEGIREGLALLRGDLGDAEAGGGGSAPSGH